MADRVDAAGRVIAGLLGYSPGPGIYSRLERAVQAMPENVRVQELPGLLKRYKEGVPGWELKATDLDSVIAGRDVVPRDELLAQVRASSPVYTHKEIVLGGRPAVFREQLPFTPAGLDTPRVQIDDMAEQPSRLGSQDTHGDPKYADYGQGGGDYAELLLVQPDNPGQSYGNHWGLSGPGYYGPVKSAAGQRAVAHARYDTHGDALRINELQSDLGIHNRKVREGNAAGTFNWDPDYLNDLDERGIAYTLRDDGSLLVHGDPELSHGNQQPELPFPMEDNWSDLLIKRLALEAARQGHRAIEVASPRAIADKVGGNIENYEHFYGKVVPGAIERLGRKMGGLEADTLRAPLGSDVWGAKDIQARITQNVNANAFQTRQAESKYNQLVDAMEEGNDSLAAQHADDLHFALRRHEFMSPEEAAQAMPTIMFRARNHAADQAAYRIAHHRGVQIGANTKPTPGRRYLMSDEMRRRLIEQGVGASILGGLATQQGE